MRLLPALNRPNKQRPKLSGPAASGDPVAEPDGVAKGMSILSYLVGGIVVYGGLGFLGAHFLHWGFLVPVGIFVGVGLSLYLVIVRYGDLGSATTEALVTKRSRSQADWARRAGRPEGLNSSGPTTGIRGEDAAR